MDKQDKKLFVILSNSEYYSYVEDGSGGAGVSSVSKSGTTLTAVKAPKC